jgi:hypothetical protein
MVLSPQGPGIMGLSEDSWKDFAKPLLVVQAGEEQDFTGQTPTDKISAFTRSPAGYKHLAWFAKGHRTIYAGSQTTLAATPLDGLMFEDVKAETTAFLIAYANYDQPMFAKLQSNWPEAASDRRLTYRTR